jgi:hypothetical protein
MGSKIDEKRAQGTFIILLKKWQNNKLKVVEKAASLLLRMMQDLLDKIEQHLCHEKIQSIKILILT